MIVGLGGDESSSALAHVSATVCWGRTRNRDCILYPGKGTVVLIRPAQTFYERINFISDYGDGGAGVELGGRMFGEAYSPSTSVRNVTVQRNEIHVTTVQTTDRGGIESLDNLVDQHP